MSLKIQIVNIVATANIEQTINLEVLAELPFITYNPSRYFCAYFKDETMEAKVSIFTSGKMIAAGATSEISATRDLHRVARVLNKLGYINTKKSDVTVRNIVITVELTSPIDIEEKVELVPGLVYDPEQFPGVIFRPLSTDVTVLVFASGKMVVTGLKSTSEINTTVTSILKELDLEI